MSTERKIIVLGAGASIGSKRYPINSSFSQIRTRMPSAENFFYDLFRTNKTDNRPAGFLNFLGLTYEGVNHFLTRAWAINDKSPDSNEWKGVNIEEVMTFFEIGSKMFPAGSKEKEYYRKAKYYLLDFLYPLMSSISESQHCEYLLNIFFTLKPKDSIISYNWDTIADYTLEVTKSVQFRNYKKLLESKNIEPTSYRKTGLFLKLHGSFNWLVCRNQECRAYNKIRAPFYKKQFKLIDLHQLWKCPVCKGVKVTPEIVPPVSAKIIHSNSFIRNQWLIAREKLLDVTELVFIGYSFPPTDHYTEWLFRQLNLREGKKDLMITIVNPEYGKRGSLVSKRYDTIFKGYKIRKFSTLKDYANK